MTHSTLIDAINGAKNVDAIMSKKTKRATKKVAHPAASDPSIVADVRMAKARQGVTSKKAAKVVEEKPSFDFYTRPDGSPVKLRPNTKRKMICDAWFVNNAITLDEVAQISHWSRAVNSSELYQIAVIFGRKIERVGDHYKFIID